MSQALLLRLSIVLFGVGICSVCVKGIDSVLCNYANESDIRDWFTPLQYSPTGHSLTHSLTYSSSVSGMQDEWCCGVRGVGGVVGWLLVVVIVQTISRTMIYDTTGNWCWNDHTRPTNPTIHCSSLANGKSFFIVFFLISLKRQFFCIFCEMFLMYLSVRRASHLANSWLGL